MASTRMSSPFSSPFKMGALGVGGSLLASNFFKDQPDFTNPSSAAKPYLDQVPGTLEKYYDPYINEGREVSPFLKDQYKSLTSNPTDFLKRISSGYTESPGYQRRLAEALNAGNNAAAAGGMAGSPMHQRENMGLAESLAGDDYENYIQHALGIYGQGLSGLEGFNTRGYGASTDLSTSLANALMTQSQLSYQGQGQQNEFEQQQSNADSDWIGQLSGLASLAAFL